MTEFEEEVWLEEVWLAWEICEEILEEERFFDVLKVGCIIRRQQTSVTL